MNNEKYDYSIIPALDEWTDMSGESIGTGKPVKTFTRKVDDMTVVYSLYRSNLTLRWHPQIKIDEHKVVRTLRSFETEDEAYDYIMRRCGFIKEQSEECPAKTN